MIREGLLESSKITRAERNIKKQATNLQHKLQSIQSEKEIRQFFNSNPIKNNINMEKTLRYLDCDTVRHYARSGTISNPETVQLMDLMTDDLMTSFSPKQREAFFQGLVEMKDQKRSFRQLFCMLINPSSTASFEIIREHFPSEHFVNYLMDNLARVRPKKIGKNQYLALHDLVIEGRMERVAQIVIREAIRTDNFIQANQLLKYLQNRLGLSELGCDLLTEEEMRKFESNSSVLEG